MIYTCKNDVKCDFLLISLSFKDLGVQEHTATENWK